MEEKAELMKLIVGTNRGLLVTAAQKQSILAAIARLEGLNPTPLPLEASELLNGDWRLLYTTSPALLNLDNIPLSKLGQVYQCIRVETASIYNIAETYGLPYLEGIISVAAKFVPVSEKRVEVNFQRSIVGWQKLLDYKSPADLVEQIESGKKFAALDLPLNSQRQLGWLEITYLDSDLRIARGNRDSIFVLCKP
jgi:hypothetical protein